MADSCGEPVPGVAGWGASPAGVGWPPVLLEALCGGSALSGLPAA